MFCRDEPDIKKIEQLLEKKLFFPSKIELERLKTWTIFNMKDILTFHDDELRQFRGYVRYEQEQEQEQEQEWL